MLNLREAVETVSSIAQASSAYPTAHLIQLRGDGSRCVVSAFDGFKTAHAFAVDEFNGTANVDGKQLARALAKIVDPKVSIKADKLTVSGSGKLTMSSLPNEIAKPRDVEGVTVNGAAFRAVVKRVQHAVSTDTTRPSVHCINITSAGQFVATDGACMALAKGPDGLAMLLPAWWIPMVLATNGETLTISVDEKQIAICDGDVTMVSPAIGAAFPPFQQVIPKKYDHECSVSKARLLEAITVAELSGENYVRLEVCDGALVVDSVDAKSGSASSSTVEIDGAMPERFLGAAYLRNAVNFVDGDTVHIHTVNSDFGPVVFSGAEPQSSAVALAMPVNMASRSPRGGKKK